MGVVFRARDRKRNEDVALKTLRAFAPEDVYRLKQEFRSVAGLAHPNLVRLHDLVASDEHCFFTMELVQGRDFVSWVRGDGGETPLSPQALRRLRGALGQLALGLAALHGAGRLHRDVKPSNVLVDDDGRVVLLDLGLVGRTDSAVAWDSARGRLVGTLAYMAPEQGFGELLTPASDWYGVGAIVFEALTGRLPFESVGDLEVLLRKRDSPPPPPSLYADGVPGDLEALVIELLRPAPDDRPTGREVLECLGSGAGDERLAPPPGIGADPGFFVGRREELRALYRAFDATRGGQQRRFLVDGPSGIGKTTLLAHFASRIERDSGALVLRSRCHYSESVPYKALDGIVDHLSQFLSHQTSDQLDALMPLGAEALTRVFPVLGRLPAFAVARDARLAEADPPQQRRLAFEALRELLSRLALRRPLVLWIDDLQWGDLDSIGFLRALATDGDPLPLLLLTSFRSEDRESSAPLRALTEPGDERRVTPVIELHLAPLTRAEVAALARNLFGPRAPDEAQLEGITEGSGGSPFLAAELARGWIARGESAEGRAVDPEVLIRERIARLPRSARAALEWVAVSGRPLDEDVLLAAAAQDDLLAAVDLLVSESLLRRRSLAGSMGVETYHDRIREAVVHDIDPERQRRLHRRLADVLEALPDPDPHELVDHLVAADEHDRGARYAYAAAERDARVLGFDRAAALYRRALDLGIQSPQRWVVLSRLGEVQANAGRGAEAARSLEMAAGELEAGEPASPEVQRLRRAAGQQYMISGYTEDGLRVSREVLRTVGLRYSPTAVHAVLAMLLNLPRLAFAKARYRRRGDRAKPARVDPNTLETIWSVGVGLSTFDAVRAAEYAVRHGILAYRSGDPVHVARAISIEASQLGFRGGERRRKRSARLHIEARRRADELGDPALIAFAAKNAAWCALFAGRWREALALCEATEESCRECPTGVAWERDDGRWVGTTAMAYLGELDPLRSRLPGILREARERDDQYGSMALRTGLQNLVWLADDDLDEAVRQLEVARGTFPTQRFHSYDITAVTAACHIALYSDAPEEAWERLGEYWPRLRRSLYLRTEYMRTDMLGLRARMALALAAHRPEGAERTQLLRVAERDARRLGRESLALSLTYSDLVRAGIEALRGAPERAPAEFERAALGFDRLEMPLHAACARIQAGRLVGGAHGDELVERHAARLAARGVADPVRFASVLAPRAV